MTVKEQKNEPPSFQTPNFLGSRSARAAMFKEDADLFVGRSRRDCPFSHAGNPRAVDEHVDSDIHHLIDKKPLASRGGGFGYHIDMATLHENPAIEATRIVWEHELEGTARELLNAAEGDQGGKVPKLDMAKRFLDDILASARLPVTEIEELARAANVSWATVRRASDEMGIRKFREGNKSWWQLT